MRDVQETQRRGPRRWIVASAGLGIALLSAGTWWYQTQVAPRGEALAAIFAAGGDIGFEFDENASSFRLLVDDFLDALVGPRDISVVLFRGPVEVNPAIVVVDEPPSAPISPDQALEVLARVPLTNAIEINLDYASNETVRLLQRISGLTELRIVATQLSESHSRDLAGLRQVRSLTIYEASEGNTPNEVVLGSLQLESLGQLEGLESLRLLGTAISEDGLRTLARLENLRDLTIVSANLPSQAALDALQAQLPQLSISTMRTGGRMFAKLPSLASRHKQAVQK